ncbi:MAG: FtsQ-type POTRA domain-containing protein [Wenzhouxiangella sp.]|nr:MAG: FtsQ-type POTRA domain-containing protein [Wenzhouxiangella sp.]
MADTQDQPRRLINPATLASLVLLGSLVLGALWMRSGLIGSGQWPIRWLDVEGELQRTSASQVRAAAAVSASRGFFAVDLGRVRAEIEALPWIATAEVSRHWPDALYIRVVEHRPVARWNENGLFSDRGEVFEVTGSESMQGLARLVGPESRREEVLETWLWMRHELAGIGIDIARLTVDERGAWRLGLGNGIELILGREHIDQRLARFIAVHDLLRADERRLARVDMRYTNGLAVRWAGSEPVEDDAHG